MNLIAKTIAVPVGILVLVYCFVGGSILLIEGKHPLDPYIDTEFAPKFTPKKFDEIQLGMTKEEVIHWIGFPLWSKAQNIDELKEMDEFHYTNDGNFKKRDHKIIFVGDFAWYRSYIYFEYGKVSKIDKGWSYD